MIREYNKLVRDRIPEIIEASGRQYAIAQMSAKEFQQALHEKLIEEAQEASLSAEHNSVGTANPAELIKELADLYEVIDTLMAAYQIERSDVISEQEARRVERGGFNQRLRLLWSEAD